MEISIENLTQLLTELTPLLTAAGAFIVAFIKILNNFRRKEKHIAKLVGKTWNAKWLTEDKTTYTEDTVEFLKWTGLTTFKGQGIQGQNETYPIDGEITAKGVVILTYRSREYPTEGHIGTVCMTLDTVGRVLDGYWIGHQKVVVDNKTRYSILPGSVEMQEEEEDKIHWLRLFWYSIKFWM